MNYKLSILKNLPIMLALCQHNALAYYAFYYAGIFDTDLTIWHPGLLERNCADITSSIIAWYLKWNQVP